MGRVLVPALVLAIVAGACTAEAAAPVPISSLNEDAGAEATARIAALGFLRAYADLPTAGPEELRRRVGPAWMLRWVDWLDVQRREFLGDQTGEVVVREIGPAASLEIPGEPDAVAVQIPIDAVVSFAMSPERGEPFEVARAFSGPMLLFRASDGAWLVTDVVRDGVPLSRAFQPIEPPVTFRADGLELQPDSFVAAPVWQFHLWARLGSGPPLRLEERDAALVTTTGEVVARADVVSSALGPLRPGSRVPAIVTFPALVSAEGVAIRLRFRPGPVELLIPLEELIRPIVPG